MNQHPYCDSDLPIHEEAPLTIFQLTVCVTARRCCEEELCICIDDKDTWLASFFDSKEQSLCEAGLHLGRQGHRCLPKPAQALGNTACPLIQAFGSLASASALRIGRR